MFPAPRRTLALLILITAACARPGVAADDSGRRQSADLALDDYLDAAGLPSLRASLLENLAYAGAAAERAEYARRLASVYASLIEGAASDAETIDFEDRCERLLESAPDADTLDLRLALARARYQRAERAAERRRIGLDQPADTPDLRRVFVELLSQFDALAERADTRVRDLDRQQEAGAPRDELMLSALAGSRRARSLARYLGGWSAYYAAELDTPAAVTTSGAAQAAQVRFGTLLEARRGTLPTRDRVSAGNLRYDHIARAALGVGLCWAIRGDIDEALEWIDLVDAAPDLEPAVRAQLPARRIIVLARGRQWGRLASFADRLARESAGVRSPRSAAIQASDARLLAWLALGPGVPRDQAMSERLLICKVALGTMVSSGKSGAVLDLVERYLELSKQSDAASAGYLTRHLRALRDFDAAGRAHRDAGEAPPEAPTTDPGALVAYRSAISFAEAALSASDAPSFADARPFAVLLAALARFYSATDAPSLVNASGALEKASRAIDERDRPRSAGAMRLAIAALDLAAERGAPDLTARRRALIDDFIARFPHEPAAGVFAYQRAVSGELLGDEAIEALLAVEGGDRLRGAARHEAARLLYARFTASDRASRSAAARRFLEVALPLLDDDRRRLLTAAGDEAAPALLNARRALDAALALDPPARDAALRAYDLFSSLVVSAGEKDQRVLAEHRYRSVQIALMRADHDAAEREAAALAPMNPDLARAARRELFQGAQAQWAARRSLESARRLVNRGRAILTDLSDQASNTTPSFQAGVAAATAQAAAYLWAEAGDAPARELAAILFRTAMRSEFLTRGVLIDAGEFFESVGLRSDALDAWRTLLAGLAVGTDDWFRAKVRTLTIIAELEPARAREALDQHRTLYPDLAPPPWDAALREIDRRLAAAGYPPRTAAPDVERRR